MKKMQSYLMRPEELRKKLENPKFRSTFLEWSKSNVSLSKDQGSKQNRSKSPLQSYQKSLNLQKKTHLTMDKQNVRPNVSLSSNKQSNQKLKVTSKDNKPHYHNLSSKQLKQRNNNNKQSNRQSPSLHQVKKRVISESSSNNNQKNYQSNGSLNKNYISSLSSKHRYNSCSSIINNNNLGSQKVKKKQRANSCLQHNDSTDQGAMRLANNPGIKFELKYAYRTKQGVQITNPNKTNQDSLLIKTNLSGVQGRSMFAIADGHGISGHLISQYLVKNLSKYLQSELSSNKSLIQSLPPVYNKLQQTLFTQKQLNATCSGSTMVNVIIEKQYIVCANVGDSRAILARQIDRKNWEMIYLSQDHKPTVEGQKKRILKHGGKIHAFKDDKGYPLGPQRVWLPNQNMQGLAMSRSFGDNVSKPIGVTHIPEIIRLKIDKRDRFVLLASDGVWEFITNQEVLQLLVPFYRDNKLEEACDALMNLAYERWTVEDKSIVDDITLVLVFFKHDKQGK